MQDLFPKNRLVFWSLWAVLLVFLMIPSLVLLENLQRYWKFFSAWQPGVLKTTRIRSVPHAGAQHPSPLLDLRFVEFALRSPAAKEVRLAGDFNRWQPQSLPLRRDRKGEWSVLVPLPPGRYEYLFQVDGIWTADPRAEKTAQRGDVKISVRHVQ